METIEENRGQPVRRVGQVKKKQESQAAPVTNGLVLVVKTKSLNPTHTHTHARYVFVSMGQDFSSLKIIFDASCGSHNPKNPKVVRCDLDCQLLL